MDYQHELTIALQIVQQAAQLARRIQAELITSRASGSGSMNKPDRSPVTVADFAIQALVARRLMLAFPADGLMAEEDSSTLRNTPLLDQVTAYVSEALAAGAGGRTEHAWDHGSAELKDSARPAPASAEIMGAKITPSDVCDWIDRGRGSPSPIPSSPFPSRYWLLDPIDGTKGFLRGGQYAVALALMVSDGTDHGVQAQIGVLGCPEMIVETQNLASEQTQNPASPLHRGPTGALAYAVRGQGAWMVPLYGRGDPESSALLDQSSALLDQSSVFLDQSSALLDESSALLDQTPIRLHVSARSDPAQARLLRSFEAGHTNVGQIEQFAAELGVQAEPVLIDSQVKYALLAAGQGDLILRLLSADQPDYREKAWDQAAGSLVVEQAGGRATDLAGKPFDFSAGRELIHNRGVLVSNGLLHAAAVQALKTIGA